MVGSNRDWGSEYKMFLIYHVTSRDHVVKGLCDLMGWRLKFLIVSHHFAKIFGHRTCVSSDAAVYMT